MSQFPQADNRMSVRVIGAISIGLLALSVHSLAEEQPASSLAIFQQRISPILNSPAKSSCTQCHLSGVELKDYIGDSQEETFASLRAAGMIDPAHPEDSKILKFIERSLEKSTPIVEKTRKQEYEAFKAWIVAASKDTKLVSLAAESDQLGPSVPVQVIRHTRLDHIVQSFRESIWSEMGRCVNCHSPELNRKMVGRNGHTQEDIDAISWIVPRDPASTLQQLFDTGNIDINDPQSSAVLTKPVGLEEHGGGPKFALGSNTDKNFRRFLSDYAAAIKGEYKQTDQLPIQVTDLIAETGQHLRIIELSNELDGKLLRVDIYSQTDAGLSADRVATAENPVNGNQGQWQSSIYAVAKRGSQTAEKLVVDQPLATGRYVAKIFVDRNDHAKENRDYELGESDYLGQVDFSGEWKIGFREPKIVSLASVRD